MSKNLVGGRISFKTNGTVRNAKGAFDYNLGVDKADEVMGHDRIHGFKALPQPAFIEGKITDKGDLDVKAIMGMADATVTLDLANGKTIVLREARQTSEGGANTEEGELSVKFVGMDAEEI